MENAEKPANTTSPVKQARHAWWTRLIGDIKRKTEERKTEKQKENPVDRAARITANATGWIAFFTLVSVAVSFFTFWVLRSQLKEMHEGGVDTHTLAIAAQNAGDAANNAVTQGQSNARIEQRAWIGIWATTATVQVGVPLTAGLKLQQLGKTPARHCELRARVETAESIDKVKFEFSKGDLINRADMQTILPGAIMNLQIQEAEGLTKSGLLLRPLTKPRFGAIGRSDIQVFAHGKLTYDDAFGVQHWVEFCFFFQPNPIFRTGQDVPMTNCQQHNDIDDNLE